MGFNTEHELLAMQKIGKIVALTLKEMQKHVKIGVTTKELDRIGERVLTIHGARSAPILEYQFPGATCISINDEAAHGIPGERVIKAGDIVNIDVSAELGGFFADTGASMVVADAPQELVQLCDCAKSALYKAISAAKSGAKINSIGQAIEKEANRYGFKVIKNLCGHGIGNKLHTQPQNILTYYEPNDNRLLFQGTILAIETFISTGAEHVIEKGDGWTYITPDQSYVAQFEHTIIVTKHEPIILTEAN